MVPRKARYITELYKVEQIDFLDSFDVIFCGIDGVLWRGETNFSNVGEPLNLLMIAHKSIKFVSNNSLESDDYYLQRLKQLGLKWVGQNHIVHPAKTMARYILKNNRYATVFSLCCPKANEVLRDHGVIVDTLVSSCSDENVQETLTVANLAKFIIPTDHMDYVLCDINFDLSYAALAKAFQYLKKPGCQLISGGQDAFLPLDDDHVIPGFFAFSQYLSNNTSKKPIVLGKPSPALGEELMELFAIRQPKRCLVVGDSLTEDVGFGLKCGFQTLLITSGMHSKEEMEKLASDCKPDFCANSLTDFIQLFKNIS